MTDCLECKGRGWVALKIYRCGFEWVPCKGPWWKKILDCGEHIPYKNFWMEVCVPCEKCHD